MATCAGLGSICFSGPGGGGTGIKEIPHMCAATCLRTPPSAALLQPSPQSARALQAPGYTDSSISEVSPEVPCASTETLL